MILSSCFVIVIFSRKRFRSIQKVVEVKGVEKGAVTLEEDVVTLEEDVETGVMVVAEGVVEEVPKAVAPRNRRASMSKMRVPFLHCRETYVSIKYSFRYHQGAGSTIPQ